MKFVPLYNFKQQLIAQAVGASSSGTSIPFTDENGNNYNFGGTGNAYQNAMMPFFVSTIGDSSTTYSPSNSYITMHASGKDNISENTTSVLNEIGVTNFSFVRNSKGWTYTIEVVGSAPEAGQPNPVIKSFFATRKLPAGSSSSGYNTVLWAIELDGNGVELNAENNYTAHFAFSIEYAHASVN